LRAILRKALAKRPEDRYASAAEMLAAFDILSDGKKTPSRGSPAYLDTPSEQRQRRDRRTGDRRQGARRGTEASDLPWHQQPMLVLLAGILALLVLLVPMVGFLIWKLLRAG
jgi:hypothetical protein